MPDIIFDTNVLSNFAKAGQITLLRDLYPHRACCSGFVVSEIMHGLQHGHQALEDLAEAALTGWPGILEMNCPAELRLFAAISLSLGAGESSCISIAANRGHTFACDDRLARHEAMRLGIPLTGTVGILIKAARIQRITIKEANRTLQKMIKAGFHAPTTRIEL